MTHDEFKQKLFQERPNVKKEYDALESEFQRERANIKQTLRNKNTVKPA